MRHNCVSPDYMYTVQLWKRYYIGGASWIGYSYLQTRVGWFIFMKQYDTKITEGEQYPALLLVTKTVALWAASPNSVLKCPASPKSASSVLTSTRNGRRLLQPTRLLGRGELSVGGSVASLAKICHRVSHYAFQYLWLAKGVNMWWLEHSLVFFSPQMHEVFSRHLCT